MNDSIENATLSSLSLDEFSEETKDEEERVCTASECVFAR